MQVVYSKWDGVEGGKTMVHLLLALHDLLAVELELRTLEDVSVGGTSLTRARGDGSKETTSLELLLNGGLELGELLALNLEGLLLSGLDGLSGSVIALLSDLESVELLVPLAEGGGIDLDDAVLHEGVGADELVVGGVVHDVQKTSLLCDSLRSPGEAASVETKSTLLDVATTDADVVDTSGSDSGHSSGTSELELTLHAEGLAATSGGATLVKLSTSDTHDG